MKTCRKCGGGDFGANGACKPCRAAYMRSWVAANREKARASAKRTRDNNLTATIEGRRLGQGFVAARPLSAPVSSGPVTLDARVAHLSELAEKLHHNVRLLAERRNRSIFWPVLGALIVWSLLPLLLAVLIFFGGILSIGAAAAGAR